MTCKTKPSCHPFKLYKVIKLRQKFRSKPIFQLNLDCLIIQKCIKNWCNIWYNYCRWNIYYFFQYLNFFSLVWPEPIYSNPSSVILSKFPWMLTTINYKNFVYRPPSHYLLTEFMMKFHKSRTVLRINFLAWVFKDLTPGKGRFTPKYPQSFFVIRYSLGMHKRFLKLPFI
jgi:hypothetical protein